MLEPCLLQPCFHAAGINQARSALALTLPAQAACGLSRGGEMYQHTANTINTGSLENTTTTTNNNNRPPLIINPPQSEFLVCYGSNASELASCSGVVCSKDCSIPRAL